MKKQPAAKSKGTSEDARAVKIFEMLRERNPDFDLIIEIFGRHKGETFELTSSVREMIEQLEGLQEEAPQPAKRRTSRVYKFPQYSKRSERVKPKTP